MDLLIERVRKTNLSKVIEFWGEVYASNDARVFKCDIHNIIRIAVDSTLAPCEVGYLFCIKSKPASVVVPVGSVCLSISEIVKIIKYVMRERKRTFLSGLDWLDGFDNGLPF